MASLSVAEIEVLLAPYVVQCTDDVFSKLGSYLDLLVKWNGRMNLTAIRDPREMVKRHFGESLFAARHLGQVRTLLDFGSGAGFPGIPIALLRPDVRVTLAESQGKKATFLREVVRVLGLPAEVWGGRVEEMTDGTRFDCVTLRSVDGMQDAVARSFGVSMKEVVVLTTSAFEAKMSATAEAADFAAAGRLLVPDSIDRLLLRYTRGG